MRKRTFVVMAVAAALTVVGLWNAAQRAEAIIIVNSIPEWNSGVAGVTASPAVFHP